jgi:hypothetical protein
MGIHGTRRPVRHGCHAGIPGTGPRQDICTRCRWLLRDRARCFCTTYRSLTGRDGSPIDAGSPACRHFGRRPSITRPKGQA